MGADEVVVGVAAAVLELPVEAVPLLLQAPIDRVAAAIAPTMASWVFLTRITPWFQPFR
jgi:hypothetical protein